MNDVTSQQTRIERLKDRLRTVLYPVAVWVLIAIVWGVGWATSIESKTRQSYWSSLHYSSATTDGDTQEADTGDTSQAYNGLTASSN